MNGDVNIILCQRLYYTLKKNNMYVHKCVIAVLIIVWWNVTSEV